MIAEHWEDTLATAQQAPDFDALAAALAAQANAISQQSNAMASQALWLTWGGVVFAVAALILGVSWAIYVKLQAETMARREAAEWMDGNANELIAEEVAKIMAARERKNGAREQAEAEAAELEAEGGTP